MFKKISTFLIASSALMSVSTMAATDYCKTAFCHGNELIQYVKSTTSGNAHVRLTSSYRNVLTCDIDQQNTSLKGVLYLPADSLNFDQVYATIMTSISTGKNLRFYASAVDGKCTLTSVYLYN